MMAVPLAGDLLVRRDQSTEQYSVVETDTGKPIAGPFDDEAYANGFALSMATKRSVRAWTSRNGELVRLP
jgi:hypothetical protein